MRGWGLEWLKYFRTLAQLDGFKILFHICTLDSNHLKGQTESYFKLLKKLNDHHTRCFNSGLHRIHPNDCNSDLN